MHCCVTGTAAPYAQPSQYLAWLLFYARWILELPWKSELMVCEVMWWTALPPSGIGGKLMPSKKPAQRGRRWERW
jgi:hypothetical protein